MIVPGRLLETWGWGSGKNPGPKTGESTASRQKVKGCRDAEEISRDNMLQKHKGQLFQQSLRQPHSIRDTKIKM